MTRRLVQRGAALLLPAALLLGAAGTATAAPPPKKPTVTRVTPSSTPTTTLNAEISFSSTESGVTFDCTFDGGAEITGCSSPYVIAGPLAEGLHTFAVQANDGSKQSGPTTVSWTIDLTGPTATATRTSPAANPSASTTATFTLGTTTVETNPTFTCSVDGATAETCTSPYTVNGLGHGSHTLSVVATDALGNVGTTPGTATWDVDLQGPAAPQITVSSPTADVTPDITFDTPTDAASFACAIDDATPDAAACSGNSVVVGTDLTEGAHTVTVIAYDALGNASTPGTGSVTVDLTGPGAPSLVSGESGPTSSTSSSHTFGSETGATFLCDAESTGTFAPCDNPFVQVGPLSEGPHTLDVKAVDALGNVGTAVLNVAWTVDLTAPTGTPVQGLVALASGTGRTTPAFDFALPGDDADAAGFACKLDDAADFGSCTLGALLDGPHTLVVALKDAAGNIGASTLTYTWTLDTTGPSSKPNVGGLPENSGVVNSTPVFAFTTGGDVASYVCKLDSALVFTSCTQPVVTDGAHTLQVAPVDSLGNQGEPVSYTWTLDTAAPHATAAFPVALAGPVVVTFDENVLGVGSSTVTLVGGSTLPVSLSCRAADGSVVSCADEAGVRSAVLTPVRPRVPGQTYQVVLSGVNDAAGNAAVVTSAASRALTVLQESQAVIGQTWAPKTSSAAYGGSFLLGHRLGDSVSYAFTGKAITWYTMTGPSMGTAKVYCGTTLKGTVNNYASAPHSKVARTVTCSTASVRNTLRVVATGAKGNRAGTGTNVVVDAVKVGTSLNRSPVLVQRLGTLSSTKASGGRYAVADLAGESFKLTFRGTAVTWRTLAGTGMGKAKVYVDGVLKGTFDNYASSSKALNRTFAVADGVHTIKVVATGTRRAASTGTAVALDRLTVT